MKKQLKDIASLKEKRIKVRLSRVISLALAGTEGRKDCEETGQQGFSQD